MTGIDTIRRWRAEAARNRTARSDNIFIQSLDDRGKGREGFRDSTFLYIKAVDSDTGQRPIPAGTLFWNSPHVELFEGEVLIPTNQLKEGQDYTIEVTVTNGGDLEAASCSVDLFICNPSLGFNVAAGKLIGVRHAGVGPHGVASVRFNYTASAGDIGHRCLFARAYSVSTRDYPSDASALNAAEDRHIGQQNLSIVQQGTALPVDLAPMTQERFSIALVRQNSARKTLTQFAAVDRLRTVNKGQTAEFRMLEVLDPALDPGAVTTLAHAVAPLAPTLFPPAITRLSRERLGPVTAPEQPPAIARDPSVAGRPVVGLEQPADVVRRTPLEGRRPTRSGQPEIPANPVDQVRPLAAASRNQWRFTPLQTKAGYARTLLMVPHLGLVKNEAVTYLLKMKDDRGNVTGGITLVVVA
jgi:hypothetical protein